MSILKQILRSTLDQEVKLLNEDQLMHFRKIHKPINELSKKQLYDAISLVESTLSNAGVDLVYQPPQIKTSDSIEII